MKFILLTLLTLISVYFVSCQTDNYYNTERILRTDKDIYSINDSIRINLVIKPLENKKVIKFYENYKNFSLSFSIVNDSLNVFNGFWSEKSGIRLKESKIITKEITKTYPLEVLIKGVITREADSVLIKIPELNLKAVFPVNLVANNYTYIRIHGHSLPIKPEPGASLEEYFNQKDIKILVSSDR